MTAESFRNAAPSLARTIFLGFGVLYLALGFALGLRGGLMLWLGLCLLLVGVAYATQSSRFIGKRSDGGFHAVAALVHAPFLLVSWVAWHFRQRRTEPMWDEVAPGIYVGRRVRVTQLPPGAKLVVDLTCELFPPPGLRGPSYRCLPTLDGCAPERTAFDALTKELAQLEAPVFIFCAAGHGRSATLAAAVIVARGLAPNVIAAEAMMKTKRPLVGLGDAQRKLVTELQGAPQP